MTAEQCSINPKERTMSREVRIAACQFRVERLRDFSDFEKRVTILLDKVPSNTDYTVFPELFTVGLLTLEPEYDALPVAELIRIDKHTEHYRRLFQREAKDRRLNIIAGSHLERQGDQYLNVAHIFTADGRELTHAKTHIFPAEANWSTGEGDELRVIEDVGPAKIAIETCYEAEIPELSRIHALMGAELVICPSFTFTEYGFWRVRHCAQARCVENQIYFTHCCTAGEPGAPLPNGFARSSILTPCDSPWTPKGVVAEAETNQHTVVTGTVDLDALYKNRQDGAAPTFRDRTRRADVYRKYEPYATMVTRERVLVTQ
jgi:predicted amidohydrolase